MIYLGTQSAANNIKKERQRGKNDDNVEQLIMRLHCFRAIRKDTNHHVVVASPFTYASAALYLSGHPKFGGVDDIVRCQAINKSTRGHFQG